VNRIEIPDKRIHLEEYFNYRPETDAAFPNDIESFNLVVTIPVEGVRDLCKIRMGTAVPDENSKTAVLLDIDFATRPTHGIEPEAVQAWIASAHAHCENFFEGCLTEKTRKLFGEISDE
jgi:uncharacterized protein (TIGR04255 family)